MYLKSFMRIQYVDRSYTNVVGLKRAMKSKKFFQFCCPWLESELGSQEQVFYLNGGGNAKMVYFVGFGGCFTFLWRK